MKFLVLSCFILLIVTKIYSIPHHDHKHEDSKNEDEKNKKNCTESKESNVTESKELNATESKQILNFTEHNHDKKDKHEDQSHDLTGLHTSGHNHHHHPTNQTHNHNETMSQHESHMGCHQEPMLVDCSETMKGKYIFKHLNATHHQCTMLESNKCSSSTNSFETIEKCETICHHDNHHTK